MTLRDFAPGSRNSRPHASITRSSRMLWPVGWTGWPNRPSPTIGKVAPAKYEAFGEYGILEAYRKLPEHVRVLADKNYSLLKDNPQHPSLHFKKVGRFWSVRVGTRYRALATEVEEGLLWFWIGSHADYDDLIN